jgi:hypothetical protein
VEAFIAKPVDSYGFVAVLANSLETHLFKRLFVLNVKSRDEPYQVRMKIIRNQLYDKTNLRLRRGVVSKSLTYEYLETAPEDDLKSDERKYEERKLMERLVRESESWEDMDRQKKRIKEETEDGEMVPIEEVVIEDDPTRELVEETAEERACRESAASALQMLEKCKEEMRKRLEGLAGPSGERLVKNWQTVV